MGIHIQKWEKVGENKHGLGDNTVLLVLLVVLLRLLVHTLWRHSEIGNIPTPC